MKSIKWTKSNSLRAHDQGWNVFNIGTSELPVLQIQREDEQGTFDGDYEAINHVLEFAHCSPTCRKAIKLVYKI